MTIFTYKVDSIRTGTVGKMTDVVKYVEWTLTGTLETQSFSLPQKIELSDPESLSFIPFAELTEEDVIEWIENTANLEPIKSHIQYVLDQEILKESFTSSQMPWAPVVEPSANTSPPPAANT